MKNRTVFAFLAGFATCAGALYVAGSQSPAIFFAAGALASTALTMALGWAFNRGGRRHRRVKVNPQHRSAQPVPEVEAPADSRRKCEAGTFKRPTAPASPMEADVVSALKNWGTNTTDARERARQAIGAAGAGANFEQVLRLAVQRRRA